MKNLLFFLFSIILLVGNSFEVSAKPADKFMGKWQYLVDQADPRYQTGTLIFTKADGKLVGNIQFSEDYMVKMNSVEVKDDVLQFDVYVESQLITVNAKITDGKLKGVVKTPDGEVPFEAERKE